MADQQAYQRTGEKEERGHAFLQRMVAKAVSEALTQAMNRKLQKQTDELDTGK